MDINQVTAEINAILGAPGAFALTVGVSILVIWPVVNWGYARQVNALRGRLETRLGLDGRGEV